ncbi:hypothetical protein BP6252_08283 [Coleophoma cylindrospora]|uniref:Uncharacterized protein n=1 Tax=Coleophoma cylindrospora TaxID=1849047 RepID=A0A3D8R5F4_9HELO|nr:hypothetical protein BP6252_08283 [Coleophoma cylindrospora]
MDVHALATAALSQVTQSQSSTQDRDHDPDPVNVAASRSSPNDATAATGVRVEQPAVKNPIDSRQINYQPSPEMSVESQQYVEDVPNHQVGAALPSTSSDNSQYTTDGHDTASTPPTSDGFSSQSTIPDTHLSQLSQLSQLAAARQPLAQSTAARLDVDIMTAGSKRTADGQVKPTMSKSPTSPNGPYRRGHSRTTSTFSNASSTTSRIGELSSELRTRLSYAMVKVNNGWQSNSIDEVESLASQSGSPTSSNSTLHGRRNLITSPRAIIANAQNQGTTTMRRTSPIPPTNTDFDLYPNNNQPSRTYESFWQDHSSRVQQRHPIHSPAMSPPAPKLSLAPPADIRPTSHSRRSDPKFSRPPTIPGQSRSDLSQSSNQSVHTPRTPNRDFNENPIQTPTQKSLREQDAIETLVFMSSPGNSGNVGNGMPPLVPRRSQMSPAQTSPLKHEFGSQSRGAQGRRVNFEKIDSISNHLGGYNSGRSKMNTKTRPEDIDKMLDEMGDSSSDEDNVVLSKYSSPRRVTAGRF